MSKETGGPAFPIPAVPGPGGYDAHEGMTLRDYFAAHAPEPSMSWWDESDHSADDRAIWAYEYADAMLAHRNREAGDE